MHKYKVQLQLLVSKDEIDFYVQKKANQNKNPQNDAQDAHLASILIYHYKEMNLHDVFLVIGLCLRCTNENTTDSYNSNESNLKSKNVINTVHILSNYSTE